MLVCVDGYDNMNMYVCIVVFEFRGFCIVTYHGMRNDKPIENVYEHFRKHYFKHEGNFYL